MNENNNLTRLFSNVLGRGFLIVATAVLILFIGGISAVAFLGNSSTLTPVPTQSSSPTYSIFTDTLAPTSSPSSPLAEQTETPSDAQRQGQYVPSGGQTRSDCSQLFFAHVEEIQAQVRSYFELGQSLRQQKSSLATTFSTSQEFIENNYSFTPAMIAELASLDAKATEADAAGQAANQQMNIQWHYPGCQ